MFNIKLCINDEPIVLIDAHNAGIKKGKKTVYEVRHFDPCKGSLYLGTYTELGHILHTREDGPYVLAEKVLRKTNRIFKKT